MGPVALRMTQQVLLVVPVVEAQIMLVRVVLVIRQVHHHLRVTMVAADTGRRVGMVLVAEVVLVVLAQMVILVAAVMAVLEQHQALLAHL